MPDRVQVDVQQLLRTLQDNLAKHEEEFAEAVDGWKAAVAQRLADTVAAVASGDFDSWRRITFDLPEPHTYASEYERAIKMLEWEERESIELDRTEFTQFVMDEWAWKGAFAASTSGYTRSV